MTRSISIGGLRKQNSGFALVELMFALVILSVILSIKLMSDQRDSDRIWAGRLGHEIRTYNDGLASLLASEPGFPVGAYLDFNFLRHTSCPDGNGTANQHYIPCDFTIATTRLGDFFQSTTVASQPSGVAGVNMLLGTTVIGPISRTPGGSDAAIAGLAGAIAQGYSINVNTPVAATIASRYTLDQPTATITAVTTSNPGDDLWLRTDGANTQNANITFSLDGGGQPRSDIDGVRNVIGQQFVDWDNNAFFVDPAGESEMNDVNVNQVDVANRVVLEDAAEIATDAGDLNVNGADGVSIDPGIGSVVIEGDNPGEGILDANDVIVRAFNENFVLSDILPNFSMKGGFVAPHHSFVPKPDCPAGSDSKIIIHSGFRVGADGADQVVDQRVFMSEFACDGDDAVQGPGCDGAVPLFPNSWTVRYLNPANGAEYPDDERIVTTYCRFPQA